MDTFRESVLRSVSKNARIAALFGTPAGDDALRLYVVLANDSSGTLSAGVFLVQLGALSIA